MVDSKAGAREEHGPPLEVDFASDSPIAQFVDSALDCDMMTVDLPYDDPISL